MEFKFEKKGSVFLQYANATERSVFLTGKAGTGKTTLIRDFVQNTCKNVAIAAPTGIAAVNAKGVTLHSLLHLPFGPFIPEKDPKGPLQFRTDVPYTTPVSLRKRFKMGKEKRRLIEKLETLVIDEVSMLRADLLDCIDHVLRQVRKDPRPFGGLQLLFVGDLFQLPPVTKGYEQGLLSKYYAGAHFFHAAVFREVDLLYIELEKVYRQHDDSYLRMLNKVRNGRLEEKDINILNKYFRSADDVAGRPGYVHITTHNKKASAINEEKLNKLKGRRHSFHADVSGTFPENMQPLPEVLELKKGAQVMFIKNDPTGEGRFYNGKTGIVHDVSEEEISVRIPEEDKIISVFRYEWTNRRYKLNAKTDQMEEKVKGRFRQFPLKLAWAITVHKSQGLTFDKAIIDLSDAFAEGQVYVALSRLRSFDGLVLSAMMPEKQFAQDEELLEFVDKKVDEEWYEQELQDEKKAFLVNEINKCFNFTLLEAEITKLLNKGGSREDDESLKKIIDGMKETGMKFIRYSKNRLKGSAGVHEYREMGGRLEDALKYFFPFIDNLLETLNRRASEASSGSGKKEERRQLKIILKMLTGQEVRMARTALCAFCFAEGKWAEKDDLQRYAWYKEAIKKSKKNSKKPSTASISYGMYKEGLDIADIAERRGLVESTVTGHLCPYVMKGKIPVGKLLEKEKLQAILKALKTLEVDELSPVKDYLGDAYTYEEIKLAKAHLLYTMQLKG